MTTEFKGTPGPWTNCWSGSGSEGRAIMAGVYPRVAYVHHNDKHEHETLANAALVAAAPDLLERLVMAVARIEDMLREDDGQAFKEARKALPGFHAAIEKALQS